MDLHVAVDLKAHSSDLAGVSAHSGLVTNLFNVPRWYHGHMSGGQAETLLQAKGEPWTFLVRESLSQPGDFVLSVLNDQPKAGPGSPLKVTHIKVMCEVSQLGCGDGLMPELHPELLGGSSGVGFKTGGARTGSQS